MTPEQIYTRRNIPCYIDIHLFFYILLLPVPCYMLPTKAVSLFRFARERNGLIDTVVCVLMLCYYSYLVLSSPPYTTCNVNLMFVDPCIIVQFPQ